LQKTLEETIDYKKLIWINGFIKSTVGVTSITLGVTFIFNAIFVNEMLYNFTNHMAILGVFFLVLAVATIGSIDKWAEKKKKEELIKTDKYIQDSFLEMFNELDNKSQKTAIKMVGRDIDKINKADKKTTVNSAEYYDNIKQK